MAVPRFPDQQSTGKYLNELGGRQVANIAAIATADGSDPATTQALANANKAKINAILAAMKASGAMVADA
jgi:hypothetical protein